MDLRRLLRNPDVARELDLFEALGRAPERRRFSLAAKDVIRAIHAVPTLFDDCGLDEVEVYIGRAGATPRHVFNRWKIHRQEKEHQYGIVILRCETGVVDRWEGAAANLVKRLETHGRLCVRNASARGQGGLPDTPLSCIYITWRTGPTRELHPCDRRTLEQVASDLAADLDMRREQLLEALDPLTRPLRDVADVGWQFLHDDQFKPDDEG
jgi:hypothetical protein